MVIKKAEINTLAVKPSQYPPEDKVEIAFAGRSNVGKSSLLNLITGRKNLARVSGSPGKTRTINFFDVIAKVNKEDADEVEFRIVDLPGYGYARVSKKMTDDWGPMMETFLPNRRNLRVVVQLVDIRHEPTAQDVQMYEYLRHYGLSGVIVATKADKIKRSQLGKSMAVIRKTLDLTDEDIIIPVSALKHEGQDKLLDVMERIITE
ncbi:MAG: YihA family ribosome biogenesis GTP-binding protein [Eubacterium sp.]|nr:YihA family ribosome biogenesis GTP-binding protein [Eubacterium sp.]